MRYKRRSYEDVQVNTQGDVWRMWKNLPTYPIRSKGRARGNKNIFICGLIIFDKDMYFFTNAWLYFPKIISIMNVILYNSKKSSKKLWWKPTD